MKTEHYESLITEIEDVLIQSTDCKGTDLSKISDIINLFRDKQYNEIKDPIEFAKKVCELSGCKYSELKVKTRKIEVIRAKQLVLVSLVNVFKYTPKKAANSFGNDRCMYYHSRNTIKNDYKTNREYREMFSQIFSAYPQILE